MANNRENQHSEVRGPTSALTAFLRSKNIRVPNANRFRRRDDVGPLVLDETTGAVVGQNGQILAQAEDIPAIANEIASGSATPSSSSTPQANTTQSERLARIASRRKNQSMNFEEEDSDATEDEGTPSTAKKQKVSENAGASSSASSGAITLGDHSLRLTAIGSVDFCAACRKRFSVTQYTHHTEKGGVCHKCKDLILNGRKNVNNKTTGVRGITRTDASPSESPAPAKRSKARRKPNQLMFEKTRLPTLQSMCINIIADNIEDVEGLIGIANQNMDSISKSISKNRRLNSQTVNLFLQSSAKELTFYDCSALDSDVLASIPAFCPFIESINLQLCGMLDNTSIDAWSKKCKNLRKVELYGPFLVRVDAWHRFFQAIGERLTTFKIRESPRFDKGCCEKLVEHCPNVTELGLAQIGPLNGDCLSVLKAYAHQLTYLDISDPGVSAPGVPPKGLEDDAVIEMLKATGPRLMHLNISRNADLTSRTLLDGILANCISLQKLHVIEMHAEEILPEHWVSLFQGLKERGAAKLTHINLERCSAVNDSVIEALIDYCGANLVELNLNSCDKITESGFKQIAQNCRSLKKLDVGFCRAVDDAIVTDMINNIRDLQEIWLFSCNRITPFLTSSRVRLLGKEKYAKN